MEYTLSDEQLQEIDNAVKHFNGMYYRFNLDSTNPHNFNSDRRPREVVRVHILRHVPSSYTRTHPARPIQGTPHRPRVLRPAHHPRRQVLPRGQRAHLRRRLLVRGLAPRRPGARGGLARRARAHQGPDRDTPSQDDRRTRVYDGQAGLPHRRGGHHLPIRLADGCGGRSLQDQ